MATSKYQRENTVEPENNMSGENMMLEEGGDATTTKSDIRKYLPFIPFLLVAIIASGAAFYFYRQLEQLRREPQKIVQEEVTQIVDQVGKLIVLPAEVPTLATVTDPEKLKDQPFFANAKIGDKVLIYPNAKKAILYDPVQGKILEVAPLNIGNQ